MATTEPISAASSEEFDLFLPLRSRGGLENPFAVYSLLRTVRPVMRMPIRGYDGPGVWFLTRYAEVERALRDPRFSVERLRAPFIRDNLDRLPAFIRQGQSASMLVRTRPTTLACARGEQASAAAHRASTANRGDRHERRAGERRGVFT